MKTRTLYLLLVLAAIGFFGCSHKTNQRKDEVIPVKVVELKKEKVQDVINVSGAFTTDDETYLSFKTGGIIKSIYVNEGDMVKKGQLLATLELNEIHAGVSQAQSGYEKALRDYDRVKNLFKDSVATLSQLQDTKTSLDIAAEQLTIAKYNLNHSEIRATQDGYVLKKFVNEGQLVAPGTPVFQTNGAVNGNWLLKAGVSDADWAAIEVGDKAVIQTDVNPNQNIDAYVLRKSEGIDPYSGTFYIEIKIKADRQIKIASGLFGNAKIFPLVESEMWIAPYQAVLDGDGNSGFVFTTNDMKTVSREKVNIFSLDKNNVYINAGLNNSKYLIVTGSAYLNDNSQIKIENN